MDYVTLLRLLLLMSLSVTYSRAETLVVTDRRLPLVVETGRSAYLTMAHLPINPKVNVADMCQVEVDDMQPLSSAVGHFKPKKFPCLFQPNTVLYQHEGSPLLSSDSVILNIYFYRKHFSIFRNITIQILITAPKSPPLVVLKSPLTVGSSKGISEALSDQILQIKFNFRKEFCRLRHFNQAAASSTVYPWLATRYWPLTGLLITFNKSKVYEFNMECRQALLMGYRFMHRRTRGPVVDFLPLIVEISDIEKKTLIDSVYLQIPIVISSSSSSSDWSKNLLPPPVVENFRSINLRNSGGTISLLPNDILEVRTQDKNRGPLIANIISIQGNDHAKFVNMRDPSKAIWSFVLSDLQEGLIGFQLLSYSETVEKVFRVDLVICDSYFVQSEPLIVKIVDELDNKNQPFQVFTTPFYTYTGKVQQIRKNHIQVIGEIDHSLIRYRILSMNGTYGYFQKHPSTVLFGEKSGNSQYFNIEDIKNGMISYYHNGGLENTDVIKIEASIDRFRFIRFNLPVYIVRVYNRSKDFLLEPVTELLTPTEGIMVLPLKRFVRWSYFYYIQRDNIDISFTIVKEPGFGNLLKLFPWENVTDTTVVKGVVSISDLINGLVYYQSSPSSSNRRDIVQLQQNGRMGQEISIISFNIKLYVTNFLIPKMDRNVVFTVLETNQFVKLSYLNLNFVNSNLQPRDVMYRVTRCPMYDSLDYSGDSGRLISLQSIQNHMVKGDTVLTTKLRHYRSAQITSVISFSQQQILDGDIVYVPPYEDVGPRDRHVSFLYSVRDSYGSEIRNLRFSILVKAVNNRPPFVNSTGITVARDEETVLSRDNVDVGDVDTEMEDLVVEIVQLPSYGRLTNEKNVIIKNGSRFSATSFIDKNIKYRHNGRNVKEDLFKIRISDGAQFSPVYSILINITKRVISNSSWNLYINNSVLVKENLTVVLHVNALQTVMKDFDFSSVSNPTFILVAMPTRGNLLKDDNVISTFFFEEIKEGKIQYQHTATEIGSKAQYDFIQIWILETGLSFNINFTILPVNSQAPIIKCQSPLQVNEGGVAVVSYYTLGVLDIDSKESDLNIKVMKPPLWGKISAKSDRTVLTSFTVADIRLGKVLYVNSRYLNGLEQTNDIFTVQAFDEEFSSTALDIPVVIHPTNDEIPNLVLKDFNIALGENKLLGERIFHVSDADIPRDVLQIYVTQFPGFGNLTTLYKHGEVKQITKDSPPLTLQMLKFVSILYMQKKDLINPLKIKFPVKDHFELTATDGKHRVFKKCVVNITGFNIYSPVIFTSLVQMNKIAEKNITNLEVRVKDDDTQPEDVVITLLSAPSRGSLLVNNLLLKMNDVFTQRNINFNQVKYKYKGQAVSYTKDSFVIKAFDGSHESKSRMIHIFLTQPIQKPKMVITATGLKVEVGRRFVLDRRLFKINNPVPDVLKSMIVTVTRRSTCGSLYHYKDLDNPLTKFLFSDLESREIILFIAECPEAVKFMNIPMSFNYQLTYQQNVNLYVEIIPRSNLPPVLERLRVIEALIGSNVVLTKEMLLLSDQDTASDRILFRELEGNNSDILVSINDIEVTSFTQYDVNSQKVIISIPESMNQSRAVLKLHVTDGDSEGYLVNGNHHLNGVLNVNITITEWIHKNLILLRFSAPKEMKFVDGYNGFSWNFDNILVSRPNAKIVSAVDLVAGFFYNIKTKQSVKVFSQVDVNKGWIYYFLDKEKSTVVSKEIFQFKILYDDFKISTESLTVTWNIIEFDKSKYKLCPQRGLLSVVVLRKGDLTVESQALVGFISKEAIIDQDYRLMSQRLLVFVPGQQNNTISIKILLTGSVKTPARFLVTLKSPRQAVFGQKSIATISIRDRDACNQRPYFLPERSLKSSSINNKIQSVKDMIHDFNDESDTRPEGMFHLPSSDQLEMRYSEYLLKKRSTSRCVKGWHAYSKRCYRPFYKKVTWKTANNHCTKLDSYLVSISSETTIKWLTTTFNKLRSFWIGLHRPNSSDDWKYPNNEAVMYLNWSKGFPKKSGRKHRDCIMVTKRDGWKNRPCSLKRNFFVCMKNPQVII